MQQGHQQRRDPVVVEDEALRPLVQGQDLELDGGALWPVPTNPSQHRDGGCDRKEKVPVRVPVVHVLADDILRKHESHMALDLVLDQGAHGHEGLVHEWHTSPKLDLQDLDVEARGQALDDVKRDLLDREPARPHGVDKSSLDLVLEALDADLQDLVDPCDLVHRTGLARPLLDRGTRARVTRPQPQSTMQALLDRPPDRLQPRRQGPMTLNPKVQALKPKP